MFVFYVLCHCLFSALIGVNSEVVVGSSANMHEILAKQPVLMEFYAPWCSHCQGFQPVYKSVGEILSNEGINVVKFDIVESPAIQARFDIDSVPTFFLYRDNKMYKYANTVTLDGLVRFSTEEYKKLEPMPFWTSPVGPLGSSKGFLITLGVKMMNFLPHLTNSLGVPEWVGFLIVASSFGLFTLLTIFCGIFFSVQHAKLD